MTKIRQFSSWIADTKRELTVQYLNNIVDYLTTLRDKVTEQQIPSEDLYNVDKSVHNLCVRLMQMSDSGYAFPQDFDTVARNYAAHEYLEETEISTPDIIKLLTEGGELLMSRPMSEKLTSTEKKNLRELYDKVVKNTTSNNEEVRRFAEDLAHGLGHTLGLDVFDEIDTKPSQTH